MRMIGSGSETLGEEQLDWGRGVMDLEINFVTKLPMTSTGKIMRGELRKEEIRKIETKES